MECSSELFTEASGYLSSPEYPHAYPEDLQCNYSIRLEKGLSIILKFLEPFEIDDHQQVHCPYDQLKVLEISRLSFKPCCQGWKGILQILLAWEIQDLYKKNAPLRKTELFPYPSFRISISIVLRPTGSGSHIPVNGEKKKIIFLEVLCALVSGFKLVDSSDSHNKGEVELVFGHSFVLIWQCCHQQRWVRQAAHPSLGTSANLVWIEVGIGLLKRRHVCFCPWDTWFCH